MATFLYFAYGSNMLTERLRARCPSARGICLAMADGYQLAFSKIGRDGSGKATLIATGRTDDTVHGVIFEIQQTERASLDRAEGGYHRDDMFASVRFHCRTPLVSATYMAPPRLCQDNLQPFDWYRDLVVAGAREHGLPTPYMDRVLDVGAVEDPQSNREGRIEAHRVLKLHRQEPE